MKKFLTAILATVVLTACQSLNPIAVAETSEQRAYALYGTFVIFEEQAAKIVQAPEVPDAVKRSLRDADAVAKPAVDAMIVLVDDVLKVKAEVQAGTSDTERLRVITAKLESWYFSTKPKVLDLVNAVKGAK